MKMLTKASTIHAELSRLIRACSSCQVAVAWASVGFDAFHLLSKNRQKIQKMVVGTHFYQTHPAFIESFLDHPNVRFILKTDDLFHPKVYFFEMPRGGWACLVGSPNFTPKGCGQNDEMAVLLTNQDFGADDAVREVKASIAAYWEKASRLTYSQFEAYREAWKRRLPVVKTLRGKFGVPGEDDGEDHGKSPLEVPILRMTWPSYFQQVKNEKRTPLEHCLETRLQVLSESRSLLTRHKHFNEIDTTGRRRIAGLVNENGIDYCLFGSMTGVGKFQHAINHNDENLSLALDLIPQCGEVTRDGYLAYIEEYKKAFGGSRHGVATASRLLAMKRPDVFVCLNKRNMVAVCKAFGIKISRTDYYEEYWDSIIKRIMESTWWGSPQPASAEEREVWSARAAFLDSIFYDGKDMASQ